NKRKAGLYNDGGGLYLRVTESGSKSWIFRYRDRVTGKLRDVGLGAVDCASRKTIGASLTAAREAAAEAREHVRAGRDPKAERDRKRFAAIGVPTFEKCAKDYIAAHRKGWKSEKHADQWTYTLIELAGPVLGPRPVNEIDTALVMRVLEPLWHERTETASRLRGRIEAVLDWAKVQGYRDGENPARWRGHLDKLLPRPSKVRRVKHHEAMPYRDVPAFMRTIPDTITGRCLAFTILTATRTNESIAARWSEIDLESATWTVPAERMKAEREHKVPLPPSAVAILKRQLGHDETYVFPSPVKAGSHLSNMAMLELLKDMGRDETVHGFRSSFRDWAAEQTNFPRELAEAALAHALKDKTEAAYQRGDLLEKR